jgi:hypothetical protein
MLDGDTFDLSNGSPLVLWRTTPAKTLGDARSIFNVEAAGKMGTISFDTPLIPIRSTTEKELQSEDPDRFVQVSSREAEKLNIDDAMKDHKPGDVVVIPALGRTDIVTDGSVSACEVYDLHYHRHVRVGLPDAAKRQLMEDRVTRYAVLTPVYLQVRITGLKPYLVQADLVDLK